MNNIYAKIAGQTQAKDTEIQRCGFSKVKSAEKDKIQKEFFEKSLQGVLGTSWDRDFSSTKRRRHPFVTLSQVER